MKINEIISWVMFIAMIFVAVYFFRKEKETSVDRDFYKQQYEQIQTEVDSLNTILISLEKDFDREKERADSIKEIADFYKNQYDDIKDEFDEIRDGINDMSLGEKIEYFKDITGINLETTLIDNDTLVCMSTSGLDNNIDLAINYEECQENFDNCLEYSYQLDNLIESKDSQIDILDNQNQNLRNQLELSIKENELRKQENEELDEENSRLRRNRTIERIIGVALIIGALAI